MHSNLQMFSLLRKSELMKHILLSVSILSLLLSYSSWRFLFNFRYFYSFPSQLFSYPSTKNFIFLLSNGILGFIVKNSGLLEKNGGDSQYGLVSSEAKVSVFLESDDCEELEDSVVIEEERGETASSADGGQTENGEPTTLLGEVQEADSRFTVEEDDEEKGYLFAEEEEEEENGYLFEEEEVEGGGEGEGGGGGNGFLSIEELNRKFDEFIRRMKEEIRIEAQQNHLVMV